MPGCRSGDHLVTEFFEDKRGAGADELDDVQIEGDDAYSGSFDELRTGFTAAVSHELRTPLARILALLDSTDLPDADVRALIDQARAEVENAGALIDEILFLSELESGREVVSLGHTTALPVLEGVLEELADAGVVVRPEAQFLPDPLVPELGQRLGRLDPEPV